MPKQLSDEQYAELKELCDLYHDFKHEYPYNAVYKNLMRVFRDLQDAGLIQEIRDIPHPYREYFIKGMRRVVESIDELADNPALPETQPTNEENDEDIYG